MQLFINTFNKMNFVMFTESGDLLVLPSVTHSTDYYMRRLKNTTMFVAHVEFNQEMSHVHVSRIYFYSYTLLSVIDFPFDDRIPLYITLHTSRKEVSTINSVNLIRIAYNIWSIKHFSQQLLPPPYVTMCKREISRTNCLDQCLLNLYYNDGRLVKFVNKTLFSKNKINVFSQNLIARKCDEQCSGRPCFKSNFQETASVINPKHQTFRLRMEVTETKLVTSPRMTFEELLISLLNVFGIWLGLSIIDCVTYLMNGLNWIDNQRIP